MEKENNLVEEEIEKINNLKKNEKFNIILYYKLNKSLVDYKQSNYELGYEELYNTYNFLQNNEDYSDLLNLKEKNIIGALKN